MNTQGIIDKLSWIDSVAGGVWILLTIIMLGMLIKLHRDGYRKDKIFKIGVGLLIFVWLYPLYTGFYQSLIIGEIGNIATLIFTIVYFSALKKKYNLLQNWMIPQIIWLSVATFYVGLMIMNVYLT